MGDTSNGYVNPHSKKINKNGKTRFFHTASYQSKQFIAFNDSMKFFISIPNPMCFPCLLRIVVYDRYLRFGFQEIIVIPMKIILKFVEFC